MVNLQIEILDTKKKNYLCTVKEYVHIKSEWQTRGETCSKHWNITDFV